MSTRAVAMFLVSAALDPTIVVASTSEEELVSSLQSCASRLEAGSDYGGYVEGFDHAQDVVSGALEFMRGRVGPSANAGSAQAAKQQLAADLLDNPMEARSRVAALVEECLEHAEATEAIFNGAEASRSSELEAAANAQRDAVVRAESESERADQAERRAIAAEAAAEQAKAEIVILKEEHRRRAEAKSSSNENSGPGNGNENSVSLNVRENVQRALRANGYNVFESAEKMNCSWTGSAHLCKRPSGGMTVSIASDPYRIRILNADATIDCLRLRKGEMVAQGSGDDCQ
ncbi:hypothetical protein PWG15_35115 (plasmid) [Ensifer adhaerens]|uniref:hypothetical protein n=1 Tax=Ensifer adhaerens TaxID=106592 RepID=UPI0023A9DCAE|nr:hypothetical protein [Ensifer adhaerens]WDZ81572.1 hypothetical protein PWG15_35115 [Ensifer adhaerens]